MKKLLTIAAFCYLSVACSSDDSSESTINMLATGKWNLSGVFVDVTNSDGKTQNINVFDLDICPSCLKDDQMEILGNGLYAITLGENLCENNVQIFKFPHNGTWCFTANEDSIILNRETDSILLAIKILSEEELRLVYTDTIPQMLIPNDTCEHEIEIFYQH